MHIYIFFCIDVHIYIYIHLLFPQPYWLKRLAPASLDCSWSLKVVAMAQFDVKRALVVNDVVVPATRGVHAIVDPHNMFPELDVDGMVVDLVHLKAAEWTLKVRGDSWVQKVLNKSLQLPCYTWWKTHCARMPLLLEVQQLIRDSQKGRKMGDKKVDHILPLEVRGKVLWFLNCSRSVSLALRKNKPEAQEVVQGEAQGEDEDHAITDLQWFLSELGKDAQSMLQGDVAEQIVPHIPAPSGREAGPVAKDLTCMVAESLKTLRADPGCKSAGYHPSKNQFSVVRKNDKARKQFRVMQLKRKLGVAAGSDSLDLEDEFAKAVQLARTWMTCEEVPDPLADAPAEDSDEEAKMAGDESLDHVADAPAEGSDEEAEMAGGEAPAPLDDAPAKGSDEEKMASEEAPAPRSDAPAEDSDEEAKMAGDESLDPVADAPAEGNDS